MHSRVCACRAGYTLGFAPLSSLRYIGISSMSVTIHHQLDGKYSERVQIPEKAFLSPTLGYTCHTYYFAAR